MFVYLYSAVHNTYCFRTLQNIHVLTLYGLLGQYGLKGTIVRLYTPKRLHFPTLQVQYKPFKVR